MSEQDLYDEYEALLDEYQKESSDALKSCYARYDDYITWQQNYDRDTLLGLMAVFFLPKDYMYTPEDLENIAQVRKILQAYKISEADVRKCLEISKTSGRSFSEECEALLDSLEPRTSLNFKRVAEKDAPAYLESLKKEAVCAS